MNRIFLGIDPGTTRIGYGVIEERAGTLHPLAWGIIGTPGKDSQADKQSAARQLADLLATWKPHAAGVERLFFMNNKRSAMSVSEMRGVLMLALATHQIPVHEFTPLQVKQRVCGHGGAKKAQVEQMVRLILRIQERITPDDAADALAIALCCATAQDPR
ncbi:MAG: crossover junction endodeoxyribonuclease RuvC [Candidatus Yanofskybacteria bacterium]|nr:crossover junction endodeoxyribonuclease RuvC [Candidatus Yanofskybacteria bacterium]